MSFPRASGLLQLRFGPGFAFGDHHELWFEPAVTVGTVLAHESALFGLSLRAGFAFEPGVPRKGR